MPQYVFRSEDGEEIEEFRSMANAPTCGVTTIERGGKVYTSRIPRLAGGIVRRDVHFTSNQLPLNWKHAPRVDAMGKAQFDSKRELNEALAKDRDEDGAIVGWDA